MENVAGTGIQVLDCALSVNEIKGLPAIPEDVCSESSCKNCIRITVNP